MNATKPVRAPVLLGMAFLLAAAGLAEEHNKPGELTVDCSMVSASRAA